MRSLIVGVAVVLLAGCSASSAIDSAGHNVSDRQTCADFVQLKRDVTAGILSTAEQRDHVKAIYHESGGAATPAIRADAQALLASITTGDTASQVTVLTKMTTDCNW